MTRSIPWFACVIFGVTLEDVCHQQPTHFASLTSSPWSLMNHASSSSDDKVSDEESDFLKLITTVIQGSGLQQTLLLTFTESVTFTCDPEQEAAT